MLFSVDFRTMESDFENSVNTISRVLETYVDSSLDAFVSFAKKLTRNIHSGGVVELTMQASSDEK